MPHRRCSFVQNQSRALPEDLLKPTLCHQATARKRLIGPGCVMSAMGRKQTLAWCAQWVESSHQASARKLQLLEQGGIPRVAADRIEEGVGLQINEAGILDRDSVAQHREGAVGLAQLRSNLRILVAPD